MRRSGFGTLFLVLALAIAISVSCNKSQNGSGASGAAAPPNAKGSIAANPATEFNFTSVAGELQTSTLYLGKPLVVNFWADW